jgi:hypothetical protein
VKTTREAERALRTPTGGPATLAAIMVRCAAVSLNPRLERTFLP